MHLQLLLRTISYLAVAHMQWGKKVHCTLFGKCSLYVIQNTKPTHLVKSDVQFYLHLRRRQTCTELECQASTKDSQSTPDAT